MRATLRVTTPMISGKLFGSLVRLVATRHVKSTSHSYQRVAPLNVSAKRTCVVLSTFSILGSTVFFLVLVAGGLGRSYLFAQAAHAPTVDATRKGPGTQLEQIREERKQFQLEEIITARSGTWIFQPDQTPRVVWRDASKIRRLGGHELRIRWFNTRLMEVPAPDAAGRWLAWVESTAPNGTPLRRGLTFYRLPNDLQLDYVPDLTVALPNFPGPKAPIVVREHHPEILRLAKDTLIPSVMDSERGAILFAGLSEFEPLGRPARFIESAGVLNADHHLALKIKLQQLSERVRPLDPPRQRESPATLLHEGTPAAAGMRSDAKSKIDELCRSWAEDTAEPFVTLVARRGVIVTHEAFGKDPSGTPITRDYRCWVASITKTVTALLFSQFVDQRRVALDDRLSVVFPDYPDNEHVPTFRQCLNHTSGLSGHGEFGGMFNPQLENIVLNGIDVNEPNSKYEYCGLGFELVAKAMELLAGKSASRLYEEHLFRPLGFEGVTMGNASSDGEFTALELATLAQLVANQGSYGSLEFISPATFEQLLPEPVHVSGGGAVADEGLGLHWVRHRKTVGAAGSSSTEELLFSPRTIGHGSFSGCIFVVDPELQLVIVQARRNSGPRSADWSARFFQAIAEAVAEP